jgi:hypothetical protein
MVLSICPAFRQSMIELEKGNDTNVDVGKANAMLKHQQNMFKHLQTSKQIIIIVIIYIYR